MMADFPVRQRIWLYVVVTALTALVALSVACGSRDAPTGPEVAPTSAPPAGTEEPTAAPAAIPSESPDTVAPHRTAPIPPATSMAGADQPDEPPNAVPEPTSSTGAGKSVPGLLADQSPEANPAAATRATLQFPTAPDRDLYRLAAELSLKTSADQIPRVVNSASVYYSPGRMDSFWLVDFQRMRVYESQFELRLVSPRAYWYVEEGRQVAQEDLEEAARTFEESIYPKVTAYFGQEWSPGVDNDPHLNIIHGHLSGGVGGYFSSADEHPQSVFSFSNQRETIYINVRALGVGTTDYLEVLAHELQHAIHWRGDASEDTWVNEGLSELAVSVAGYLPSSVQSFMQNPSVSLIHWPIDHSNIGAHYGGTSLFMHYLASHYDSGDHLLPLVNQPADGIPGIDAYLREAGYDASFHDLFRDWIVANLLDEAEGVYGYPDLAVQARAQRLIRDFSEVKSSIPQYAAEYLELTPVPRPMRLRFQGQTENSLLPVNVGPEGCWWSNSGDSIASTLIRTLDLRGLSEARLHYQVWYHVEEDWDFAYVQVSTDGGRTWDLLETPNTSPENPIGNNFGDGYTGTSLGWVSESVDLAAYAGREVLLRFQYVTDDAVNGAGICFRRIAVPEAGLSPDDTSGWEADGFVLTSNQVKQDFLVQVIQTGTPNRVTVLSLDEANSAELVIEPSPTIGRLVVAVAALAPRTLQKANYTLTVEPVN